MVSSTDRATLTKQALAYLVSHNKLKLSSKLSPTAEEISVHCPFHKDKTPSMFISISKGVYNCFSCGSSGLIEKLFKELTGESLYKTLGIKFDEFNSFSSFKKPIEVEDDFELNPNIHIDVDWSQAIMPEASKIASAYLRRRGISFNVAHQLKFKYADSITINGKTYQQRLLIPIYEGNKLISVELRDVIARTPEERKLIKKCLYPRNSSSNTLYDINHLDYDQPVYVMEGLMDVAILRPYKEFKNSTSCFGACLTRRQMFLLRKFRKGIIYIPDNDKAGDGTLKQLYENGVPNVRVLKVPPIINGISCKDPGDIVTKAHVSISELINRKWLCYTKPLEEVILNLR